MRPQDPSAAVAIQVEGLSKRYLIGHRTADRTESFREMVMRSARAAGRTALDAARGRPLVAGDDVEEFWALQDVSFEVGARRGGRASSAATARARARC